MLIHANKDIIFPELSYQVVGVCMRVHNELGPSLLEKYYQRAIEKELTLQKIQFKREVSVRLEYQGQMIGKYFIDFIIDRKIILEVKAQPYYTPKFHKQVLAYLKQLNLRLGIVVNFRVNSLRPYRVVNSTANRDIRINSNKNSHNS